MSISERIGNTLEQWSERWKDRLRGWMISWVFGGIVDALETMTPEETSTIQSLTQQFIDDPNTPPELRAYLKQMPKRGHPAIIVAGVIFGLLMLIPMVTGAFQSLGNLWMYTQDRKLKTFRLDPLSVITAWRRDKVAYVKLFDDLKDQGWSDDRIEALKFVTLFYPSPQDLITWQAREVFEPTMIARYGLDDEFEAIEKEPFYKAGMTDEQIRNYWRAHWEHASWMQVVEMLRRGQLTESEVRDWFRLVEIPPFWRDKLIAISREVPTRVDVRRFWDMRTIDEARLREIYTWQGYYGKDLDDYVLWTKVYVAFPDLIMRWTNGWISLDDVRAELTRLGMPANRVEEMLQTKMKAAKPERTTKERDLTKAEIVKGVKKEIIPPSEGIELLMDMGYDEDEADFILAINIAAEAGSPETFAEFKELTQKWRKSVGKEAKPVTEELKAAAAELVRLSGEVDSLKKSIEAEERTLIEQEVLPAEATAKRDELRVTLHRAEAELARAQTDYNSLLAEWRHGR